MTLGYLKNNIRDLGFEDETTMVEEEEKSIVINAINKSLNLINSDIVLPLQAWFRKELSTEEEEWEVPEIQVFDELTSDDTEINLPNRVLPLVPLLCAHFVWLDDDVQKSTIYWNDYEEFRNRIYSGCMSSAKVTVGKGLRF